MSSTNVFKSFLLSLLLASSCFAQFNTPFKTSLEDPMVRCSLISEQAKITTGEPIWVGLLFDMKDHSHVYWKNPGESGFPPSVKWDLPEGLNAGPLIFPTPAQIETMGIISYVYEGQVLLISKISTDPNISNTNLSITANIQWLACKESCIPGRGELSLNFPLQQSHELSNEHRSIFEETRKQTPAESNLNFRYIKKPTSLILQIPNELITIPSAVTAHFFPSDNEITVTAKQLIKPSGEFHELEISTSAKTNKSPDHLSGVLKINNENAISSYKIELPFTEPSDPIPASTSNIIPLLIFSFIGGLILNLMPCVFPVLGIKIMGFVNQSNKSDRSVKQHGLAYTLGVLISFWALAAILFYLRKNGDNLGWGFQLQYPYFVYLLTATLLIFGLSLSGVFEVGLSLIGTGSNLTSKQGITGSFFSGVLSTVIATPCSAPFLAPAIGAALTVDNAPYFAIFTMMALGLSSPYLLFSFVPAFTRFLPKPGKWMESFKQFMAFPLYLSSAYLLWVLSGQLQEKALLKAFIGLVAIAFACWTYGRWAQPSSSKRSKQFAYIIALVIFIMGLFLGHSKSEKAWETWSPEYVEALLKEEKNIYVDFTARWCLTCQVNKKLVFSSKEVLDAFDKHNVVLLKADWTNKDPRITEVLNQFGRSAVPFNLIYKKGNPKPVILPEILTPSIILDELAKPLIDENEVSLRGF